ncbi:hypothetical protein GGS20DRAFT_442043 [Poronia punctata]|nr:hypothetical protein GGS20DRAFT_442043 [Poronia punctata]
MIMHSYGGLVGTEAVTRDLSFKHRKSNNLPGGVLHLFYFAAFILTEGQSVLSTFDESPNNFVKPNGQFSIKNGAEILYHDLPPNEAEYWESRMIDPRGQEVALAAFKRARDVFTNNATRSIVLGNEVFPGLNVSTDEEIRRLILDSAAASYHASCTCTMGLSSNPLAVLDSEARLYGIESLRVVDQYYHQYQSKSIPWECRTWQGAKNRLRKNYLRERA